MRGLDEFFPMRLSGLDFENRAVVTLKFIRIPDFFVDFLRMVYNLEKHKG